MIRKTLFWSHLTCGIAVGLVVFAMSLTGVLLTYERQLLAWSASEIELEGKGLKVISYQKLWGSAKTEQKRLSPTNLIVSNRAGAPIIFKAGRSDMVSLNPYTGEVVEAASPRLKAFFYTVTGLHRWLNLSGDQRVIGKTITGVSNLVFLFLIVSGVYLWLPRVWRWVMFRVRLVFIKAPTSRARDYNWHHVLGIWSSIPLILIVVTAIVFSFSWANGLVFSVFGEDVPSRGAMQFKYHKDVVISPNTTTVQWEGLIASVQRTEPSWQTINMTIPKEKDKTVQFIVDRGNGGQPHLRDTLILNRYTGEVLAQQVFVDKSMAMRTRSIIRFLHTGEVLGWVGQTIAGVASLASLFMVWTGLALSYRRLIQPLFKR